MTLASNVREHARIPSSHLCCQFCRYYNLCNCIIGRFRTVPCLHVYRAQAQKCKHSLSWYAIAPFQQRYHVRKAVTWTQCTDLPLQHGPPGLHPCPGQAGAAVAARTALSNSQNSPNSPEEQSVAAPPSPRIKAYQRARRAWLPSDQHTRCPAHTTQQPLPDLFFAPSIHWPISGSICSRHTSSSIWASLVSFPGRGWASPRHWAVVRFTIAVVDSRFHPLESHPSSSQRWLAVSFLTGRQDMG